uniref:substrate-binding domain-containing protein n=1 Tax=Faecalibacterium sp. TaxID=1971605 RepID=UPI004029C05E
MKNTKISRRSFLLGLAACSAAGILTACKGSDAPASSASASSEAPASSVSEAPQDPLFSEEDFPKLDGSTACIPLMAQMMADTTGRDLEEAQSTISVSTTAYAWENFGLYDTDTQMLVVYEAPDYVKKELEEAKVELESKPIGRDALVFIVNENNPVKSLTQQQLKDIYAGKITNWKDVGGEDLNIVAFQRRSDSGSQTLFQKLLIQGGELMDPPTELAPTAMGELVDSLAAYNNSANAIGFSVYYYIDQMYSQPGLRLLRVDGVMPSNDTLADGSYPLCNDFYAVIRPDAAADSPERQLYDWLDTEAGQACIKKAGYVPAGSAAANG